MITVHLKGGLGNQMFQYALGRSMSIRNNSELVLDVHGFKNDKLRRYELGIYDLPVKIFKNKYLILAKRLLYQLFSKNNSYIKQKTKNFDKRVLVKKKNVLIDGYWQSETYFKDIRKTIINDFKIKTKPDLKVKSMLKRIEKENSPIAIHVRRTDYVNDPVAKSILCNCSLEYYHQSVEYMLSKIKNPTFFIFSDDPRWVKKNLKIQSKTVYVNINDSDKGYEDLRLMSKCKHFIIANSSFSWWGAWLSENSDKIVCAPKRWFRNIYEGDIVPKSWIRI